MNRKYAEITVSQRQLDSLKSTGRMSLFIDGKQRIVIFKDRARILQQLAALKAELEAIGGESVRMRRRSRRHRKECSLCPGKKFRKLKMHMNLKHNGHMSNLPRLQNPMENSAK